MLLKNSNLFLIVALSLAISATALRSHSRSHFQSQTEMFTGDTLSNAQDASDVAYACYKGFMNNIPPSFCYKKNGDAGKIPTKCASGLFRFGALCYERCKSGYTFVLGVCWEQCASGYRDDGLTCYKNLFKWHFKDSYIAKSYTNFQSKSVCNDNEYKSGALCYRDCGKIGLLNCGIGACAATSSTCSSTVALMAINELMSFMEGVAFVLSFGTSSAAAPGMAAAEATVSAGFSKLGKGAVNSAVSAFKSVIVRKGEAEFKEQVADYVWTNLAKFTTKSIAYGTLTTICDSVSSELLDRINSSTDSSLDFQSFDLTGISGAVDECSSVDSESDKISCASAVLNAINFVDPTGLTGMAAAVMQPECDGV